MDNATHLRWSETKAKQWYENKGFIVGFNYVTSSAVNSTEMWQRETFDEGRIRLELKTAYETGFNACRIFLQYLVWQDDRGGFMRRFENFLQIASGYHLTVMPVLFDDCAFANKEPYIGKQDEPIPGVHNSGWTPGPGFRAADDPDSRAELENYVKDIVGAYRADERILLWDLYNEPGNSERKDKCLDLLNDTFQWARECEPIQPLTAGVWVYEAYDMRCIALSDVISFHDYNDYETCKANTEKLKRYGRPLLCTEWLHRLNGSLVETHMPLFQEEKIGIYNWGLFNGKTQTHLSWETLKSKTGTENKIWQQDLFYEDGTPYNESEIEYFKRLADH